MDHKSEGAGVSSLISRILDSLFKFRVGEGNESYCPLGQNVLGRGISEGQILITVRRTEAFELLSFPKKLKALVFGLPLNEDEISRIAISHMIHEIFGGRPDFGDLLIILNRNKETLGWNVEDFTPDQAAKTKALAYQGEVTRNLFAGRNFKPPINLELGKAVPHLRYLLWAMSPKVLVRSVRFFVDINPYYTFGKVAKSGHPNAQELINYLYEIVNVQQKTAHKIYDFVSHASKSIAERKNEAGTVFLKDDLDAVSQAESAIAYFKASVEKIMALVGATHGIHNLSSRKKHSQRLSLLKRKLEECQVADTEYKELMLMFFSEDHLKDLNEYRTQILHSRGRAQFQPHTFANKKEASELPFSEILAFLLSYHQKISIALICALAMLTDELMKIEHHDEAKRAVAHQEFLESFVDLQSDIDAFNSAFSDQLAMYD